MNGVVATLHYVQGSTANVSFTLGIAQGADVVTVAGETNKLCKKAILKAYNNILYSVFENAMHRSQQYEKLN